MYAEDLSINGTCIRKLLNGFSTPTYGPSQLLGRGRGAVLLDHGDQLFIGPGITLTFGELLVHESSQVIEHEDFNESQLSEIKVASLTEKTWELGAANTRRLLRHSTVSQIGL